MRRITVEEWEGFSDEKLGTIFYASNDGQGDTHLQTMLEFRAIFEKNRDEPITNKELANIAWEVQPDANMVNFKMVHLHVADGIAPYIRQEDVWIPTYDNP